MAPILTFTADEVWSYIPGRGKPESVHLVLFPEERGEWTNERLAADWERLLEVRGEVSRALEVARQQGKIGKGVDAVVFVRSAPEEQWRPLLEAKGEALLTTLFNVSGTRLRERGARGRGPLREPGHPRSGAGDRPGPGARLEEVRALLDVEPAGGGAGGPPVALRPLHASGHGSRAVTAAGLTALAVLVLDQLTKLWALRALIPGRPVPVIDGFFSLTLVMNPGLAFGMLSSTPTGWRWLVALLSIGALAVLAVVGLRMLPGGGRAHPARARAHLRRRGRQPDRPGPLRGVVDFLDFYWRGFHWPAFNAADSAITVGVALLALRLLTAPASTR